MKIKFLKVFNGDAIHLRYKNSGSYRNILIDGGPFKAFHGLNRKHNLEYGDLKQTLVEIAAKGERIDLLIITHAHSDHIGGILKWFGSRDFSKDFVNEVWFNSTRLIAEHFQAKELNENLIAFQKEDSLNTSARQEKKFENYLEGLGIWNRRLFLSSDEITSNGLKFTFLSPTEEKLKPFIQRHIEEKFDLDTSALKNDYKKSISELLESDNFMGDKDIFNGSSLAFSIEYYEKKYLFLGDAHADVVSESIETMNKKNGEKLKAEFVKLSHHGSSLNTNTELLNLIDSNEFIILTDGKNKNKHPAKLCLARIINKIPGANLKFNYPELINNIFSESDRNEYNFATSSTEE